MMRRMSRRDQKRMVDRRAESWARPPLRSRWSRCSVPARHAGPPAVPVTEGPAPATIEDVERMLVLGDSISLGVNACGEQGRCSEAAWATGDDAAVASVATRIGVASGRTPDVDAMAGEGAASSTSSTTSPTSWPTRPISSRC